ncbi:MAG: hypothetical protein KBF48_08150 [Xanthomonadales bacterium]|nr:hypothetical protein [Xanthomonadales bacterium]
MFVVADSRDPHWYRETAALCRKAQIAVVHAVAYPELGAEQFALGISSFYTWMVRFFDVVVATEEHPRTVLRALLDFLAEGLVCSDFADLKATLRQAGTCSLHRRAFATNDQVESARGMIERDKDLARALRHAHRVLCVVRADRQCTDPFGVVESLGAGSSISALNIVWAPDADHSDIVILCSSEPWDPQHRGDRAIPNSEDLSTLNSGYYCREGARRPKSQSHGMDGVTSSPDLLPQLSDFDVVDIPHLVAVAQFETGRSLIRNNPALGLILARWQLCCRSHERVLWWELQDEMKVCAETIRTIGEAMTSGPAAILAAAAFPEDECLLDVLSRIPARLARMQHLFGVRRIFQDESAAALHCRELLANCSLEHEDVLQLCLDIQLANFVGVEFLRRLDSQEVSAVRHHIDARELVLEAAVRARFILPTANASGSAQRFVRPTDLFEFTRPGCVIAGNEPLPDQADAFARLRDLDELLEEWAEMSNHYLGMFVLRDGWDDVHHAFYRVVEPVRATIHLMKIGSTWWLMDAKGTDGQNIDLCLLSVIAAQLSKCLHVSDRPNGAI